MIRGNSEASTRERTPRLGGRWGGAEGRRRVTRWGSGSRMPPPLTQSHLDPRAPLFPRLIPILTTGRKWPTDRGSLPDLEGLMDTLSAFCGTLLSLSLPTQHVSLHHTPLQTIHRRLRVAQSHRVSSPGWQFIKRYHNFYKLLARRLCFASGGNNTQFWLCNFKKISCQIHIILPSMNTQIFS